MANGFKDASITLQTVSICLVCRDCRLASFMAQSYPAHEQWCLGAGYCYILCWNWAGWRSPQSKWTFVKTQAAQIGFLNLWQLFCPCWPFGPREGIGFSGGGPTFLLGLSHPRSTPSPHPPSAQGCFTMPFHHAPMPPGAYLVFPLPGGRGYNCSINRTAQASLPMSVVHWQAQFTWVSGEIVFFFKKKPWDFSNLFEIVSSACGASLYQVVVATAVMLLILVLLEL